MRHSPLDVVWVLVCGVLVFGMQAGFMCLEVGLVRQKNSINVAIKNVTDFLIATVSFFLVGFGLMFGTSYQGFIGTDGWLLEKFIHSDPEGWIYTFWFFQVVFCGAAATIVSGGVAERMRFSGYMIVSAIVSTLIYPVFGHWAWGGNYDLVTTRGWLLTLGYKDFAGSSVVHMVGGVVTLACLLVLGPRKGKYNPDGSANKIWGSDIPMTTLGVFLLWMAWFGFNGGSTLAVNKNIGLIIINTNLAACTGALSYLGFDWFITKRVSVESILFGSLGGLVAITASCAYVTPVSALIIGLLAGPVVGISTWLLDKFRIDDAVGAIPVHGCCGVLGVLCVGFFGKPEFLVNGSRIHQTMIQLLGASACFFYTFAVAWLCLKLIDKFITKLRVSPEDEEKGLNLSEHGARTLWLDLAEEIMTIQGTHDLSRRAKVEPETEAGVVATLVNRLLGSLQEQAANLQDTHQRLLQSEKIAVVGRLAGGVAHEINNPLGIILGFAQGLARRIPADDPLEMPVKSIEREAMRCKHIVQDLLTFSRTSKQERETIDLNATIKETLSFLLAEGRVRHIEVVREFASVLPALQANKNQIQQVVVNLCNNAFDAMPESGRLTLRTSKASFQNKECVEIEISDTGQGIPPEIQRNIFDPFFTTKGAGKGTGLGLSIVYEIIHRHGGEIRVESQVGQGTKFRILLPLV